MTLPNYLQKLIRQAESHLLVHPQHALLPIDRYKIYTELTGNHGNLGHDVYVKLSFITARHVLHYWEQLWPDDQLPQLLLLTAEQLLVGDVASREARKVADDAWERFDEMGGNVQSRAESSAFQAACAAHETLWACIGKSPFADVVIEETDTDAEIDPWSSDTSLWAVGAVAGGVWDPKSDSLARRQFWLWWLDEAIPAAWESVVSLQSK